MKAKKKVYENGGILDKLKEKVASIKAKKKENKQFKEDVESGKIVKVGESKDIGAAERAAERNDGTVRHRRGVYSVYKSK